MRQLVALGIHTYSALERAGIAQLILALKRIVVAFVTRNLKREHAEHALFAALGHLQVDHFKADGIVKSLLVDNVLDVILMTDNRSRSGNRPLRRHNRHAVPTLCYGFLPAGNVFCQLVVACRKLLEAFCLLSVELRVVVIQLTLHCVMRCDARDGVLYHLNPALAVAVLVLVVVERYDFVLQQTVYRGCIELIPDSLDSHKCAFL